MKYSSVILFIIAIVAILFPNGHTQASSSSEPKLIIEYYWPKDPSAIYYIGSYIKHGKLHHFKVPSHSVFTKFKVKFYKLRSINKYREISRDYFTPAIKGRWVRHHTMLTRTVKKGKAEASENYLSYYEDMKLQEDVNLKKINKKRQSEFSIGSSTAGIGFLFGSTNYQASSGSVTYSTSNSVTSLPAEVGFDLYRGNSFFLGFRSNYEFSGFKIKNVYDETQTLNFSNFSFGLVHKFELNNFINDLLIGYNFGWYKYPNFNGVDVDILDNSIPVFESKSLNYVSINSELNFNMWGGLVATKLNIIPYFMDASGLSYSLATEYRKTIMSDFINAYAELRYDSSSITLDNECSASVSCGETSEVEITQPSLILGIKAIIEKTHF